MWRLSLATNSASRWLLSLLQFLFIRTPTLRHYRFLASGIPDIEEGLSKRNVGFVLRTYPDHSLIKFCEQVRPAIVIGDENPLREAEHWRVRAAQDLKVPLWTVDADVVRALAAAG